MANREKAIRMAFFNSLTGNLIYDSKPVSITDTIVNQGKQSDYYVVLDQQTATFNPDGANAQQSWNCDIRLVIITKQPFSVSKDIMDDISDQIETIIIPTPQTTNIIQPDGWQILNPYLKHVEFSEIKLDPTTSVIYKMLTFSQKVVKIP